MDYQKVIDKYYPEDNKLKRLLMKHSRDVANRALEIADRHPELNLDRQFVEEGAMLHDIGIFMTDAPAIYCHGKDPYLRHGYDGAELLRSEGFPKHARVCERHTGTGITRKQIEEQHLQLPDRDFQPETEEEKVICYADKFFSKSHPDQVRTVEQAAKSVAKFGQYGLDKFMKWTKIYE